MGLGGFFCLVYSCTEECPLKIHIVIYVFFLVGSPTSCCARLGTPLDLLTGSEFISVGAKKTPSSACSLGYVACTFSTSYNFSMPPSVIYPLFFFGISFFVGLRGGVGPWGVGTRLDWGVCVLFFSLRFFVSLKCFFFTYCTALVYGGGSYGTFLLP